MGEGDVTPALAHSEAWGRCKRVMGRALGRGHREKRCSTECRVTRPHPGCHTRNYCPLAQSTGWHPLSLGLSFTAVISLSIFHIFPRENFPTNRSTTLPHSPILALLINHWPLSTDASRRLAVAVFQKLQEAVTFKLHTALLSTPAPSSHP